MSISLAEIHEKTKHPVDAWWAKFFLVPIASFITWVLLKVCPRIHPNWVTSVSLVLGVASAALFYYGEIVPAVVVYQVCMALDWVDGKVARLTGQTSPFGAFYDGLVNHLVYIFNVIGLGFGLGFEWAPVSLVAALLALRAINNYINDTLELEVEGTWSHFVADEKSWLSRNGLLPPGSFPDKHAVLFLLCPLLGYPIVGMMIIAAMDAALLALKSRKAVHTLGRGADA